MIFNVPVEHKSKSGVYKIRCVLNDKAYVGSSFRGLYSRYVDHVTLLRAGKHTNRYLQAQVQEYGIENFEFTALEYCDKSIIREREQYHADLHDTIRGGFNIAHMTKNADQSEFSPLAVDFSRLKQYNFQFFSLAEIMLFEYLVYKSKKVQYKEFELSNRVIEDEVGLKRSQTESIINRFVQMEMISVDVKGLPRTKYITVNFSKVDELQGSIYN